MSVIFFFLGIFLLLYKTMKQIPAVTFVLCMES